jgi:hypothetical protein
MTKKQREDLLDELTTVRPSAALAKLYAHKAMREAADAKEYAEAAYMAAECAIAIFKTMKTES